jgi:hypothetical protein
MKFHRWLIGIAAALFSTALSAANCTPLGAIGKISDIFVKEGSAFVIRADCPANERVAAFIYQKLFEGDRIEITGKTKVIVNLAQNEERIFTQETNHQPLHGKTVKDIEENWKAIIASIWNSLGNSQETIPVHNNVRRGSSVLLKNDPLLPSGIQYLPAGYDQVALLWQSGAAKVVITSAGGSIEEDSKDRAFLLIPIPTDQENIKISLQDQKIGWDVRTSAIPPVPPGMKEPDAASTSDRLIRAIWILKEGPVEWRLFALSELANLSKAGFFAAEELWNAARLGKLATALKAR